MCLFDHNKDDEVSFREFVRTIAMFAPPHGRCSAGASTGPLLTST